MFEKISGQKIKEAIKKAHLTQTEIARLLGVKQAYISQLINETTNISQKTLTRIASITKQPLNFFVEKNTNDIDPNSAITLTPETVIKLPVLSTVQCGKPDFCDLDEKIIEDFIEVPKVLFPDGNFVVRCQGESMIPEIPQHAFCIIKKMDTPLHNKNMLIKTQSGFTIKRVKIVKDKVEFYYLNPAEKKLEIQGEIKIIGKVIGSYQKY
ncbi:MAG: XRE family transcriptional regulator [Endomicrobiaceae bacterium]|nr:XRE family transcriptional regulator [Endomicrobiaceae bacterium]